MNFFACHCRTFTYRNKRIEKHRGRQLVVNRVHLCFNWTCGTYTDTNSNNRSNAKWIIFKHYFFEKKTPPDLVCEVKSRTVFLPLNGAKERERAVARRGIGIWCTRAKNTKPLSCRKSFAEILPRQWHCYGEQWGDSAKNRILSLSLYLALARSVSLCVCVCVVGVQSSLSVLIGIWNDTVITLSMNVRCSVRYKCLNIWWSNRGRWLVVLSRHTAHIR